MTSSPSPPSAPSLPFPPERVSFTGEPEQGISAPTSFDHVVPGLAVELVGPPVPLENIGSGPAPDDISATLGENLIVAAPRTDEVVTAAPFDEIVTV